MMVVCMRRWITGVRVLGDCVNYGTASIWELRSPSFLCELSWLRRKKLRLLLPWLRRRKLVAAPAMAAAEGAGGCSCRGCGGGSWWLLLPWLRRRKLVAAPAVASAAEAGGWSCRGCGGGSAWARRSGHAAGCRHDSWLPPYRADRGLSSGSSEPRTKAWSRVGDGDNDDAKMAALD